MDFILKSKSFSSVPSINFEYSTAFMFDNIKKISLAEFSSPNVKLLSIFFNISTKNLLLSFKFVKISGFYKLSINNVLLSNSFISILFLKLNISRLFLYERAPIEKLDIISFFKIRFSRTFILYF